MITKFSKWIFYISSYIPLYIIFAISNILDIYSKYNEMRYQKFYNRYLLINAVKFSIIITVVFILLILISWVLLFLIIHVASKSSEFKDLYYVKKNNEKVNEYILVYILPFLSVGSNSCKELAMFAIIFIVIGIISVKNDLVYVNPILYLRQYNIYSFKESQNAIENSIIITKYSIIDMKRIGAFENGKIRTKVSTLSENAYFIKK